MSPECGTTTKNHNKVKQNETCKSKQKKMHIVWNEFIISYLHVYTCITYLQDWLSTMSWYLSFEHTAKPCLSNFRTWKFLVWPTLWRRKYLILFFRLFHSNRRSFTFMNKSTISKSKTRSGINNLINAQISNNYVVITFFIFM